ncbi:MAG: hypothetical protein A2163_08000 [Actinobacteria bacterium RBG_13_35_12]|nr:MAG: hypothetical protein A2163_08000 [Actinobacteria bacterium RBG_13_35_12]
MMWHLIGSSLLNNEKTILGKLDRLADELGLDLDDLEYAIIFADKYPDLKRFNHDKTVNWHTIKESLYEENPFD